MWCVYTVRTYHHCAVGYIVIIITPVFPALQGRGGVSSAARSTAPLRDHGLGRERTERGEREREREGGGGREGGKDRSKQQLVNANMVKVNTVRGRHTHVVLQSQVFYIKTEAYWAQ